MNVSTGFMWLRMGPVASYCEYGDKQKQTFWFYKSENFFLKKDSAPMSW
jgi:hypothetical protein